MLWPTKEMSEWGQCVCDVQDCSCCMIYCKVGWGKGGLQSIHTRHWHCNANYSIVVHHSQLISHERKYHFPSRGYFHRFLCSSWVWNFVSTSNQAWLWFERQLYHKGCKNQQQARNAANTFARHMRLWLHTGVMRMKTHADKWNRVNLVWFGNNIYLFLLCIIMQFVKQVQALLFRCTCPFFFFF